MSLSLKEEDLKLMLAANVHIGTKNVDPNMEKYVWKRRQDGLYILNLGKTYEKIKLAARIIVAIENPADVVVVSARTYGQRPVLKYAQHTGAQAIAGRFTPGVFTNQIQAAYKEPRLVIVADPRVDHQAVTEASYANIPVIAFCDSDSPINYVDVVIPANNKNKLSCGLMFWLLAREVLTMRGVVNEANPWTEMVDLFFYRAPLEIEKEDEAAARLDDAHTGGDYLAAPAATYDAGADWGAEPRQEWEAPASSYPAGDSGLAAAPGW